MGFDLCLAISGDGSVVCFQPLMCSFLTTQGTERIRGELAFFLTASGEFALRGFLNTGCELSKALSLERAGGL